jgi:hypothetical protein
MVLRTKGNPPFKCYILVGDSGWPILTGSHPYDYMPSNSDLVNPIAYQHSGQRPVAK